VNSTRAGYTALAIIVLVAIGQMGYYWPQLPPRVASEFDLHGRPATWMTKGAFVFIQAGVMLSMLLMPLVVYLLIRYAPAWTIDLPGKHYWLAPPRRAETARIVSRYMVWLFVATTLLLTGCFQLAYLANLGHPHAMRQAPLWLVAIYAGFMVVWTIRFYRRFSRPRQDEKEPRCDPRLRSDSR
jgi:uncharacterized membrane protein